MNSEIIALAGDLGGDYSPFGAKAKWLADLHMNRFKTPGGFAISSAVFRDHLHEAGLLDDALSLAGRVRRLDPRDALPDELSSESRSLRDAVLNIQVDRAFTNRISSSLAATLPKQDGGASVVFRSSALSEDRLGKLAAGCYESVFVDIDAGEPEEWIQALRGCWASGFGDRAIAYSRSLDSNARPVFDMGVVVQPTIHGDISGVCFTGSHAQGLDDSVATIEAAEGPCSGIVSGSVRPFRYTVDRHSAKLVDIEQGDSSRAPLARTEAEFVARQMCDLNVLLGAEFVFDVEWTTLNGKLVFLQARPLRSRKNLTCSRS